MYSRSGSESHVQLLHQLGADSAAAMAAVEISRSSSGSGPNSRNARTRQSRPIAPQPETAHPALHTAINALGDRLLQVSLANGGIDSRWIDRTLVLRGHRLSPYRGDGRGIISRRVAYAYFSHVNERT
jgi:hypothetical protein